jgi:hypothetical protein
VIVGDFRFAPAPGVFVGGCGVNPRGSLRVLGGSASVGAALALGIDNPLGTQAAGSWALLALSLLPDPAFPCGTVHPGWGMTAAGGEVAIALGAAVLHSAAQPWNGAGQATPVSIAIPASPGLAGLVVWAQGAILDPMPGAARPLGVTEGLELCIRP